MSRAVFLSLREGEVRARCVAEKVGLSAIEPLPGGGVRVVCKSVDGAEIIRRKLKSKLIDETATRERHRPAHPLW